MSGRPGELLRAEFAARFGAGAAAREVRVAAAPGRINLIGEHTDYNGLPVLPFAIPRYVRIAFTPRDDRAIVLRHVSGAYAPARYEAARAIPPDPAGSWVNYTKAAVQDLTACLEEAGIGGGRVRGFAALCDGDIPPAGGLSSSSALVVATAMAFLAANELELDRLELAERLAAAEHYVGTRGGGMDQAASLCGREGMALRIDFFPLRVTPVPFPERCAALACHSLVTAPKTESVREAYNLRVVETKSGAMILARIFGFAPESHLGDVVRAAGAAEALEALARELGGRDRVPIEELAPRLDLSEADLVARFFPHGVPGECGGGLRILARARHVIEEGERVEAATGALRRGDLVRLGRLMDEAHESARSLYEISCPELDELVAIGRDAGALGARLTGAGFGGFAIMLAEPDAVPRLQAACDERFYGRRRPGESPEAYRFVFRPAAGAAVS